MRAAALCMFITVFIFVAALATAVFAAASKVDSLGWFSVSLLGTAMLPVLVAIILVAIDFMRSKHE